MVHAYVNTPATAKLAIEACAVKKQMHPLELKFYVHKKRVKELFARVNIIEVMSR